MSLTSFCLFSHLHNWSNFENKKHHITKKLISFNHLHSSTHWMRHFNKENKNAVAATLFHSVAIKNIKISCAYFQLFNVIVFPVKFCAMLITTCDIHGPLSRDSEQLSLSNPGRRS